MLPSRTEPGNMEWNDALIQLSLLGAETLTGAQQEQLNALRTRVQGVVQNVALEAFKSDKSSKAVRESYKQDQHQKALADRLDEFFIENEMYRNVPEQRNMLEQVTSEQLTLIAYEVFTQCSIYIWRVAAHDKF